MKKIADRGLAKIDTNQAQLQMVSRNESAESLQKTESKIEPKSNVHVYTNGNRFEGELKDGKKEGPGKYISTNGNVFEGNFKDDMKHGFGVLKWTVGQIRR